jgi:hypothetical protein
MSSKPFAAIRYANSHIDDVAISCDMFRLEQMAPDAWWAAAYRDGKTTMFWLRWDRKARRIVASVTQDELGCTDDSADTKEAT